MAKTTISTETQPAAVNIDKKMENTTKSGVIFSHIGRSFRTMLMLVLREIKKIVNGFGAVRLRPFMVLIRYKTADCIVFVKLKKTAKYGP